MSREYWESRYKTGDMPWEKGAPSPGLVDFLAAHGKLRRATVCVPGCGTGHDAVAWAQAEFQAFGFDIAASAVRLSRQRARAAKVEATFQRVDFLREDPPFRFDWIFEHTLFCAIQPAERDEYVQAVLRWLKPNGQYLAVNYLIPDTDGPPFGTTREEVLRRFSPHFNLREEWIPRSYPNRTGLERMFWWEPPGTPRAKRRRAERQCSAATPSFRPSLQAFFCIDGSIWRCDLRFALLTANFFPVAFVNSSSDIELSFLWTIKKPHYRADFRAGILSSEQRRPQRQSLRPAC